MYVLLCKGASSVFVAVSDVVLLYLEQMPINIVEYTDNKPTFTVSRP